jgi:hypothetical protein
MDQDRAAAPVSRTDNANDEANNNSETDLPPYTLESTADGGISLHENDFDAHATRDQDGRITINLDTKSSLLTDIHSRFHEELDSVSTLGEAPPAYDPHTIAEQFGPAPYMNIVIHVVGSRGDVQPFLALAKVLKETHGHRVRLATHPKFENFVKRAGVEFFSIGGDPAELMDYMVRNAGLMPSVEALLNGDIGRKRTFMGEIARGCWRSCIEAGDDGKGFVADAIIANPPSFAHVHCAERLGVPLHLMFT